MEPEQRQNSDEPTPGSWRDEPARVIGNQEVAPRHFCLELECPGIAAAARPGQFAMIEVGEGLEPLLRRPISFYQIALEPGRLSFLYRLVGRGTSLLSRALPGALLKVIGPLGKGFPTEIEAPVHLLVGGGIGIAPLVPLAAELVSRGKTVLVYNGARSAGELLDVASLVSSGARVRLATEDGSVGAAGLVTELLTEALEQFASYGAVVYACGPTPMLRQVKALAQRHEVRAYLSLEERMACGVGACLGCACHSSAGVAETGLTAGAYGKYLKVCTQGPVFEASEVEIA